MTPPREIFYRYWGKAGTEADDGHHLLVYHCLDVAACGIMLLRWIPTWRKLLERLSGLSSEEIKTRLLVNLALHDLGKFATAFQNLRPDLLQRLQERQSDKCYSERHDTLGWLLWREKLQSQFLAAEPGRSRRRGSSNPGVDSWMQAVTGHHGEPPADVKTILRHHFDADDIEAARAFVSEILELAGVETFPMPPDGNAKAASWWLAGLAVLADWLGSNTLFFPYRDTAVPLSDYWSMALSQAERAVNATGLVAGQTSPHFGLKDCFAEPPPEFQPTPLQDWAQRAKIEPGPSLFILEDVTGAGKTEAALMLAWRLLHTNQGTGMYFGLPTMATANGMYQRLGGGEPPVYARLFGEQHLPSLVLAHGQADLVEGFRASILPFDTDEPDYGDGTVPAGPRCNAWLSDNRKKALLAEVGVGTIDQALLGVLPARHQSLRLLGLLGKVLIVDEVHACDAYMNRLLEELLRAHAHAGGSAILLSATLPYGQKKRLVQAFATGAGYDPINLLANDDYPLATCLVRGQIEQQAVNTRPDVARRMAVRFVEEESAVETLLQKTIAKDQCACWICNTVDDARSRFERLSADHPDWRIDLFHARFTLHDRLRIEQQVLRDFGKDSGPHERHRRILIATQVVEQSLDLDFDELISDLAPVDLILQRAGRLRRHKRDRIGQRVDGPDQRGTPTLTVLAPPWTDDPDPHWLRNALPGTAAVYRDEDARLWLAMKRLHESGGFTMPADARALIEGVYGVDPFDDDIPTGLREKAIDSEGEDKGRRSIAELKTLHIEDGYRRQGAWLDEDSAPTRLGEPTTTLWLARWQDGRLLPLHGDDPTDTRAWQLSSLTVRRALIAGEVIPSGASQDIWEAQKRHLPGKGRWGVLMSLHSTDGLWHGTARTERGKTMKWVYNHERGFYPHSDQRRIGK